MKCTNFNELTNTESERLALLAEECAEVISIVGKILRHGYESTHPDDTTTTNRSLLEDELGDVHAAVQMMTEANDVTQININSRKVSKLQKVKKYLHHQ